MNLEFKIQPLDVNAYLHDSSGNLIWKCFRTNPRDNPICSAILASEFVRKHFEGIKNVEFVELRPKGIVLISKNKILYDDVFVDTTYKDSDDLPQNDVWKDWNTFQNHGFFKGEECEETVNCLLLSYKKYNFSADKIKKYKRKTNIWKK